MKHGKPYPISDIGLVGATSQFSQLAQGYSCVLPQCGLILPSTLPAESQTTVAASYLIVMPHSRRLMLHSPNPTNASLDMGKPLYYLGDVSFEESSGVSSDSEEVM
ncbi:hypothetical protein BASA61_005711 [Batrachochytrium salamandrivorans]|nr:hypothetical protein BASA62_003446 [Batrachochytrium salamandrivorans]KAH6589148.1 hypothetical protein BASA61_005711 [Batrachochytrium salamandrivorans]